MATTFNMMLNLIRANPNYLFHTVEFEKISNPENNHIAIVKYWTLSAGKAKLTTKTFLIKGFEKVGEDSFEQTII